MSGVQLSPAWDRYMKNKESRDGKGSPALSAYMPTPKDRPTIGWGHTKGVKMGDVATVEQCEAWWAEDIAKAVASVAGLSLRSPRKLTQSMIDALISLVYNVGPGSVKEGSTVGDAIRNGAPYLACAGFFLWRKQSGADLRGLALRRAEEMARFLGEPF